ncbi:hypothetical protein SK128_024702, partial [Halocaridina rubra]
EIGQRGAFLVLNMTFGVVAHLIPLDWDAEKICSSGFPSKRINLSPFTKDFRGGEQLNESITHFLLEAYSSRPNIIHRCLVHENTTPLGNLSLPLLLSSRPYNIDLCLAL